MDSSECMGTRVRANRCSHAVKGTTLAKILRGRDTICFGGSSKAPRKRGSRACERYSGPIFESHLSARQERRIEKTCVQFASIEPVDRVFPLQDGGNDCSDRDDHARGLDDQNRPPGRVFLCGDSTRTSDVSKIPVGRLSVPVQQPVVRAGVGTEVVYKTVEASSVVSPSARFQASDIFGRSDFNESACRDTDHGKKHVSVAINTSRDVDKLGEVHFGALSKSGLSRFCGRFPAFNFVSATRESGEDKTGVSKSVEERHSCGKGSGKINRPDDCIVVSSTPSTTTLSTSTDVAHKRIIETPKLRGMCATRSNMQKRTQVVASPLRVMEWEDIHHPKSRYDDSIGLVKSGMGRSVWECENSRYVERNRISSAYQCSGAAGSQFCGAVVHEGQKQHTCPSPVGQYHSSCVFEQDGGDPIETISTRDTRHISVCAVEADHNYCRTFARGAKCGSGLRVPGLSGLEQLATPTENVPGVKPQMGHVCSRSVCRSTECADSNILQLETRSDSSSNRCVSTAMDRGTGVRVSPICIDRAMSGKGHEGSSSVSVCDTDMADPSMVSKTAGYGCGLSGVVTTTKRSIAVTKTRMSPIGSGWKPAASGLESVRYRAAAEGLSGHAASLVVGSWREGTQGAHNSAWNKWCRWCGGHQIDPFQATVANIINFLSELQEQGYEYNTLNVHRSAISAYHPPIGGVKVGQLPLVTRMMGGSFNIRPPQPKYVNTWDVGQVLDHIKALGDNCHTSLSTRTQKTAMLMALCTAGRGSELRAANIETMADMGTCIIFPIAELTKSKRVAKPNFSLIKIVSI